MPAAPVPRYLAPHHCDRASVLPAGRRCALGTSRLITGVAQVLPAEGRGREFESRRVRHFLSGNQRIAAPYGAARPLSLHFGSPHGRTATGFALFLPLIPTPP